MMLPLPRAGAVAATFIAACIAGSLALAGPAAATESTPTPVATSDVVSSTPTSTALPSSEPSSVPAETTAPETTVPTETAPSAEATTPTETAVPASEAPATTTAPLEPAAGTSAPVEAAPTATTLPDLLLSGESLLAGDVLSAPNGKAQAALQTDGNVVVYRNGAATWSTGTASTGASNVLTMQVDGNLVLYRSNGRALWASGTAGNPGAIATMQNDGNFVVYRADGRTALWSSLNGLKLIAPLETNTLRSGFQLPAGQQLTSPNKVNVLAFQKDGNLVAYGKSGAYWATGSAGSGSRFVMQTDGNAVLYTAGGRVVWNSGTSGNAGARLVIQDDANVVIYATDGRPLWSSARPPAPPAPVITDTLNGGVVLNGGQRLVSNGGGYQAAMQSDGNFVVYGPAGVKWQAGVNGGGNRLVMQTDGNAVIYSAAGQVRWQSGTSGNNGARMVMQGDGNLVIYSASGRVLWHINAPVPAPAPNPGPSQPGNPGDIVNCTDFSNYRDARAWYDRYFPLYGDVARLDGDGNGIPCESLPGAP